MLDNFRISLHALWRHKLRSVLTMLGIVIGIGAIIAIVAMVNGTNEQIKRNLIGAGNNTVTVSLHEGETPIELGYYNLSGEISVPGTGLREKLMQEREIRGAAFFTERTAYDNVFYKNLSLSGGKLFGIDEHYFNVLGLSVVRGRDFVEEDYEEFRKVAIIDTLAVTSLFQGLDPIGGIIEIMGEPFTVIGVVERRAQFEPEIETISDYYLYADRSAGSVFTTAAMWPAIYGFDEPVSVAVQAGSVDEMAAAGLLAAGVMNTALGIPGDSAIRYSGLNLSERARDLAGMSVAAETQLIWIACISLLVGGIGVMNIMLVSVTERSREIGLKLALGARKRRIMLQFLIESSVLTTLGGIIGVAAGYAFTLAAAGVTGAPIEFDAVVALLAIVFSSVVGLVFGIVPAAKAANQNPIDALRER